jgi:CysZ protein
MIDAFLKAWAQMPSRPFIKVLLIGSFAALLVLLGMWWGLDHWLGSYDGLPPPTWWGKALRWLADHGAAGLTLLASWLLFPAVATMVMGLLLDDVVDAVEVRDYPAAKAPRPTGLAEGAGMGLMSGLQFLGVNLLLLPVYLVLVFTAVGPFLLYLLVNGYLLGQDYMQMVAIRHLGKTREKQFRQANKGLVFSVGVATSLLFLVPFVNLFAPIVGAAMATHLFHKAKSSA